MPKQTIEFQRSFLDSGMARYGFEERERKNTGSLQYCQTGFRATKLPKGGAMWLLDTSWLKRHSRPFFTFGRKRYPGSMHCLFCSTFLIKMIRRSFCEYYDDFKATAEGELGRFPFASIEDFLVNLDGDKNETRVITSGPSIGGTSSLKRCRAGRCRWSAWTTCMRLRMGLPGL